MHGKASVIIVRSRTHFFTGFDATAISHDGIVRAISHRMLSIHAVPFRPQIILSLPKRTGLRIINNLMGMLKRRAK
jgi:anthranilate/para-aminobenzoate synthase component II